MGVKLMHFYLCCYRRIQYIQAESSRLLRDLDQAAALEKRMLLP